MEQIRHVDRRTWIRVAVALGVALLGYLFRAQVALALRLTLGGVVMAFVLSPLCEWYARRMSRSLAVAFALLTVVVASAALILLILPILLDQAREFAAAIPGVIATLEGWLSALNDWLARRNLPPFHIPQIGWEDMLGSAFDMLDGTISMAGLIAGALTEFTIMLLLCFYFLRDKQRLLLHLELLVPLRTRPIALRMGSAVRYEMGVYLRGQLLIMAIVGTLSATGLMLAGVRAFLVLGLLVGILNLIPYVGPVLANIPAALMALPQGMDAVIRSIAVLFVIQQLDGMVITPRVMGSMSGVHPALILITLMVGGSAGGVAGLLFAMPVLLILRAIVRTWMNRDEKARIIPLNE